MKNIKRFLQYSLLVAVTALTFNAVTPLASISNAQCDGAGSRILSFPKWQNKLPGSCDKPQIKELNDFWVIALNLVEILLQLVAYVSAGYVVWGGFKYLKSEGEPNKISEARSAIMAAVIGLVIALTSVAIVAYVQGAIIQ